MTYDDWKTTDTSDDEPLRVTCPMGFHWRWQDEPWLYGTIQGYESVRDVPRLRTGEGQ